MRVPCQGMMPRVPGCPVDEDFQRLVQQYDACLGFKSSLNLSSSMVEQQKKRSLVPTVGEQKTHPATALVNPPKEFVPYARTTGT